MSIGGITYTNNYQFALVEFDTRFWQGYVNANFSAVDALLFSFIGYVNFAGAWKNATAYTAGQVVSSTEEGLLYVCLISHTSAGTGTFAADRLLHPTYWGLQSAIYSSVSVWATATAYRPGQFVTSGYIWAVCKAGHTSSNSFSSDIASGYWSILVDLTTTVQACLDAVTAANLAASNANTYAANANTYAGNASTFANNASASAAAAALSAAAAAQGAVIATVTLASAATVNIGAAASLNVKITGTNTITAFDTYAEGATRQVVFAGALTLTNNASIILPGGANINTATNDVGVFKSNGGGVWLCIDYQRANGTPIAVSTGADLTNAMTANLTLTYVLGGVSNSKRLQRVVPTVLGLSVVLPVANTGLQSQNDYVIANEGFYPIGIRDSNYKLIGVVDVDQSVDVLLDDNSTAAGTWRPIGCTVPALELGNFLLSSTNTIVYAWCELGGTKFVGLMSGAGTVTAVAFDEVTKQTYAETVVNGGAGCNNAYLFAIDATHALAVWVDSGATTQKAVVLTVSGGTISVGTIITDAATAGVPSLGQLNGASEVLQLDASNYLILSNAAAVSTVKLLTVSGTTVTSAGSTNLSFAGLGGVGNFTGTSHQFFWRNATQAVLHSAWFNGTDYSQAVWHLGISGTTITASAGAVVVLSTTGQTPTAGVRLDSENYWINRSDGSIHGVRFSSSGSTTPVVSAAVGLSGPVFNGTNSNLAAIPQGANYKMVGVNSNVAYSYSTSTGAFTNLVLSTGTSALTNENTSSVMYGAGTKAGFILPLQRKLQIACDQTANIGNKTIGLIGPAPINVSVGMSATGTFAGSAAFITSNYAGTANIAMPSHIEVIRIKSNGSIRHAGLFPIIDGETGTSTAPKMIPLNFAENANASKAGLILNMASTMPYGTAGVGIRLKAIEAVA
jgi:hypothetical protein